MPRTYCHPCAILAARRLVSVKLDAPARCEGCRYTLRVGDKANRMDSRVWCDGCHRLAFAERHP